MAERPSGFPFPEDKPVILTGKILNRILAVCYGLSVDNGSVDFLEDRTVIHPSQKISTVIKITEKIDTTALNADSAANWSGTGFYKGDVYKKGIITGGAYITDALILAIGSDGVTINGKLDTDTYVAGIPVEYSARVGDLRDLGYTPKSSLGNNDIIQWSIYYVIPSSETLSVIAKITGAPTEGSYPVDFYTNGKESASTGSGTVEVLNLCLSETLPVNTWVVAHRCNTTYAGGS